MERKEVIGRGKWELDTPALCLDLSIMEANIQAMLATCRAHGVDWRPHAKCHKSPDIARRLVDAGAVGVTCATLKEAEIFAAAGIRDLLIANLVAGSAKLRRLVALSRVADPIICVDHPAQANAISAAMQAAASNVRVLVEVDIGLHRVGALPVEAVELAHEVSQLAGIEFAGFMAYEGHLLTVTDHHEKEQAIRAALGAALACKSELERAGVPCPIFSCGGTGSYPITVAIDGITEIQSGGAIFMDAFYREECGITALQNALTVIATVVSRPTLDRAVIDAGRKALSIDIHRPHIVGKQGCTIWKLSAEHGTVKLYRKSDPLEIGQQLEIIPGYADLTTVLYPYFHVLQDDQVIDIYPIHPGH